MAEGVNLGSAYGTIEIGTEGAERSVQSLATTMRDMGSKMSLAFTAPLLGVGIAAVNSAASFEQSLNVMQQVSGATAAQMAGLQEQALQLGADTSFSAGEAAAAMLELSKAGMAVADVTTAIPGVMDLAAAGNMELAAAAEATANTLNAFSLPAEKSAEIANMLAAAANASSVEVSDLVTGMRMSSAVFSSANQSVGDLNVALALLGNNGLRGSDAGTSLKTMMMRLTAPTKEAAAMMAQYGIDVYDATGKTKALPDILAQLQQAMTGTNAVTTTTSNLTSDQAERMSYLKGTIEKTQKSLADYQSGIAGVAQSENDKVVAVDRLNRVLAAAQAEYSGLASVGGTTATVMKTLTEEERNQALATIFGADAVRATNILLKEGSAGWAEMAAAVGEQGVAADVANARMKGMSGAIEYLKGSIDSFLIGTALPFLDSLGGIVRAGADMLTSFGAMPAPVKNAAIAFAAVLAAAGPLMLAISGITAVLGFMLSPIGLVVAGVAALTAAWVSNFGGIQEKTAAAWAVIQPILAEAWNWLQAQLPGAMAYLLGIWSAAWPIMQAVWATVWSSLQTAWAAVQVWLQTDLPAALATLQGVWEATWPVLTATWDAAWALLSAGWTLAQTWLQTNLPGALTTLQTAWGTAWTTMQTSWDTAWTAMQTGFAAAQTWLQTTMPTAVTTAQTSWNTWWTAMPTIVDQARATLATAWTAMQTAWTAFMDIFGPSFERVKTAFQTLPTQMEPVLTALGGLMTAFQNLWTAVQPILTNLGMLLGTVFGVVAMFAVNLFAQALGGLGPVVTIVIEHITATLNTIATVLTEATSLVKAVIAGDWSGAWESAKNIFMAFASLFRDSIKRFLTITTTVFKGIYNAIVNTMSDLGLDVGTYLDSIKTKWDSIWKSLKDSVQPVIDAVALMKEAIEGFMNWLGGLKPPNPFQAIQDAASAAGGVINGIMGGGQPQQNAEGTSYARGGLSFMHERGAELSYLYPGQKVLTNGQSNRRAGEEVGGKNITINVAATINQPIDVNRLALQLSDLVAAT